MVLQLLWSSRGVPWEYSIFSKRTLATKVVVTYLQGKTLTQYEYLLGYDQSIFIYVRYRNLHEIHVPVLEWSILCSVTWSCPILCNPASLTIACQAPLSVGFSRQERWSGLPFPSPGDLSDPGVEPASPTSPVLAGRFFTTMPAGKL